MEGTSLTATTYPWSRKVAVGLPPLSAQYTKIRLNPAAVADGGSVDFDFSGLSPAASLDVNILAADDARSKSAINDGKWERIDVALSNGGGVPAHANICLNADGTKRAVLDSGKPGYPVGGTYFYVIIDNNGISSAPVTGSFTVTQRDTCATALSGHLTVTSTQTSTQDKETETADITANLTNDCAHCNGPGAWLVTGTWSAKFTDIEPCGFTVSGSGHLRPDDFPYTYGVMGESYLSAYQNPYSITPYVPGAFLSSETGTATGCGGNGPGWPLSAGEGCPYLQGDQGYGGFYQSNGLYTARDASVTFRCHATNAQAGYAGAVTGTLTATDPVRCGLWPYCPSGPGESAAAKTAGTSPTRD